MKPRRLQSATILSMVTRSSGMARDGRPRAGRARRTPVGTQRRACQIRSGILYPGARMPIYEYRRPDGTTFEVLQKMTDDALTEDPETGVPVQRVFHPVAVHFKGKGFYNTDYGTKRRSRELERSASEG